MGLKGVIVCFPDCIMMNSVSQCQCRDVLIYIHDLNVGVHFEMFKIYE